MFNNKLKKETIDILLSLEYLPEEYNIKNDTVKKISIEYSKFFILIEVYEFDKNKTLIRIEANNEYLGKEFSIYLCDLDINQFKIINVQDALICFEKENEGLFDTLKNMDKKLKKI